MKSKLTLTDLILVSVVASVGFSLLLPVVLRQRAANRNIQCSNNLAMLGLAMHNYHAAYNQLPPGLGGTVGGEDDTCNQGIVGKNRESLCVAEDREAISANGSSALV